MVALRLASLALAGIAPLVSGLPTSKHGSDRKNVIMGWGDGMGPSVLPLTRQYIQVISNEGALTLEETYTGYETSLENDMIGKSRTGSASSLITDSAAGATAVFSGVKTNNYQVGVDSAGVPRATILEAAKAAGYLTAVITTSYVYDASPGANAAHSISRDDYGFIAQQLIGVDHPLGHTVDILLGGGLCAFIPRSEEGSCRTDDRNLLNEASDYNVALTPSELFDADSLPLVGLFANQDLAAEIDRPESQPGLVDMVDKALELLYAATENTDKGFYLFFENEITDAGQHNNDVISTISGALEISNTAIRVKEWVSKLNARGDDTLFLFTADHETGGLGIGTVAESPIDNPWGWNPWVIANATHSAYYTAERIIEAKGNESDVTTEQILAIVDENLHLLEFTSEEADMVAAGGDDIEMVLEALTTAVNARSSVGWTTFGHTGTDVDVFCFAENEYCLNFRGSHENTELQGLVIDFFGDLDLEKVAERLAESGFNANATAFAV